MLFLLTLLVILFAIVFILHYTTVNKIKKNIHNSWGRINPAERNFNKIEKYRDYDKGRYSQKLTNQTLIDIDIETLFSFLDRTTTLIGKQYLY